jgi:hypothetical protein
VYYDGEGRSNIYGSVSASIPRRTYTSGGYVEPLDSLVDTWDDINRVKSNVCVIFERRDTTLDYVMKAAQYFNSIGALVIIANCTTGTKLTEMAKPNTGQCGLLSKASLVLDGLSVSDNHKLSKIFNKRLTREGSCVFVGWLNGERTFQIVESDVPIPPQ